MPSLFFLHLPIRKSFLFPVDKKRKGERPGMVHAWRFLRTEETSEVGKSLSHTIVLDRAV